MFGLGNLKSFGKFLGDGLHKAYGFAKKVVGAGRKGVDSVKSFASKASNFADKIAPGLMNSFRKTKAFEAGKSLFERGERVLGEAESRLKTAEEPEKRLTAFLRGEGY